MDMDERGNNFAYFDNLEFLLNWRPSSNYKNLHVAHKLENFKWEINVPRTLVCHDHRGGYLKYERLKGSKIPAKTAAEINEQSVPFYSFFHWWHIDVFVYFSHHFVTVPPTVWTNQAHKHGVLMLGTFITEADEICKVIFSNEEIIEQLISKLVDLCRFLNFDGWLINIENKIEYEYLDKLEYFLKKLRDQLRQQIHNTTQVIWYDSIKGNGELKWQNELNDSNKRWFNAVDGFYTNYNWKEEHIQKTLFTLFNNFDNEKSPTDVYIGIDVFGRGCPGGGGWNCIEPMEIIRRYHLSAAIFAPGWICEKFPELGQQCLFDNSFKYWNGLKAHLHPHKITTSRHIRTNFSIGFASENPLNSMECSDEENHYCMLDANIQPFYLCSNGLTKDLSPGLIVNGGGLHDLFLCNLLVEQCDRGLELRYKVSDPISFIITISNGNETHYLHLGNQLAHQQKVNGGIQSGQGIKIELEREKMPKEVRLRQFRKLLEENNITANSSWEDKLTNLVCDQRYLLLSALERKQAFDAYCQEQLEGNAIAYDKRKQAFDAYCQEQLEGNAIAHEDKEEAAPNYTDQSAKGPIEEIEAWLPLGSKSGWKIKKIALWTPPNTQNLRLYSFEMCLK